MQGLVLFFFSCFILLQAQPQMDTMLVLRDELKLQSSWPLGQSYCTWPFVICDESNLVIELQLDNKNLDGTIPSCIGNLVSLKTLDMNKNQLEGSIPNSIGNLRSLKTFDLSFNRLTGSIPNSIEDLTSCQRILFQNNQLTGSLPINIGNCKALYRLDVSFNKLTGTIPPSFVKLTNLVYVDLNNNELSGEIPKNIGNLRLLLRLSLGSNSFSGSLPESLGMLSSLQTLNLNYNKLTGSIVTSIGKLNSLTELYLGNNLFDGVILAAIANLTRLSSLDLKNNLLKDVALAILSLPQLSSCEFQGNLFCQGTEQSKCTFNDNALCNQSACFVAPQCSEPCVYPMISDPNCVSEDSNSNQGNNILGAVIVIATVALVSIVGVVLLLVPYRRQNQSYQSIPVENGLEEPVEQLHNVKIIRLVGNGHYGTVYLGEYVGLSVALKKLKDGSSVSKEAKILKSLNHPNIIRFLGIYTDEEMNSYLVMDYATHGSLEMFLATSEMELNGSDIAQILLHICNGCAFLEERRIVHGDLALRNILITSDPENDLYCAKVSDFGLARTEQNQRSIVRKRKEIAPECYCEGRYTLKSDVWSFGVLMGKVLARIEKSHRTNVDDMWEICASCCHVNEDQRPTFAELAKKMDLVYQRRLHSEQPARSPIPIELLEEQQSLSEKSSGVYASGQNSQLDS